ncbi:DUF4369 domain-containing protein [Pedobacter sp. MC2016-14]|uniref:DUF4369 domain-containing protein n=1 Tax=Pedobacter sp. MC2016-14 TaxID=2897327 RepID=UPI001E6066CF|nr:DUF4369 domain-containing protein [Pedobacter sp. MC2016-14]MCD0487595.1 DUF4369 domain-containing protein [Pedobacter sp. MC2016-14]
MKNFSKIYALAALFIAPLTLSAQRTFSINGQLGKDQKGMMTLKYVANDKEFVDSVALTEGKFSFKGPVAEPVYAYLVFNPSSKDVKGDYREIYLEPAEMNISGNGGVSSATIKGGPSMTDFSTLMDAYKPIAVKGNALDKEIAKAKEEDNQEKLKELGTKYMALKGERQAAQEAFIKSHPDSYVAFSLWLRRTEAFIDPAKLEPEFNAFSARMRNTVEGKVVTEKLTTAKKLLPGNIAPNFTLNNEAGQPVSLASLKGKNVVLFFWARNYVPFEPVSFAMNRISRQFKDENLVILSVYYDTPNSVYNWKDVLDETALRTANIINVKDVAMLGNYSSKDKSEVMKAYGICGEAGIHAYLISPEGKILIRAIDLYKDPVADINKGLGK